MKVVKPNPPAEEKPQTREEKIAVLKMAEAQAQKIREKTIGQWFTIEELKVYITRPIPVCQRLIDDLSQFLLIETEMQGHRKRHRINMDHEWRLNQAQEVKKVFLASIQPQLDYFDYLSSIISEIHPPKDSQPQTES
jgi:hypothetical protein